MRVLHQDRFKGEIKVQVDAPDDLWHLYNIIQIGDVLVSSTYRRDESAKVDKVRAERSEKKRMVLGIKVEKMEFHEFDIRLRVTGVIVEGPQDIGSYHTLNLEEGEQVSIIKIEWKPSQLERVRRAVEDARKPTIVFVALENDEAVIAVMRQAGIQRVAEITGPAGGKMYEQKQSNEYYLEVLAKLKQVAVGGVPLVILGPGFAKETLLELGKEKEPEIFEKAFVYHTGQAGMTGIHELMKRGLGTEVLKDSRVAQEVNLVEKVLEEIAKEGPVAYGPKEVREAVDAGAVETLLIVDNVVRNKDFERMMKAVEEQRGTVIVVSELHEGGKKLDAIGGMAALLRFKTATSYS
ncbi:MAG: mRNA surveillance protein pelota [Methanomassiliicoccales archaeon]|jgi:protein pelota